MYIFKLVDFAAAVNVTFVAFMMDTITLAVMVAFEAEFVRYEMILIFANISLTDFPSLQLSELAKKIVTKYSAH